MSLAVPGLIGADLVNTASVSYQDPSGAILTTISNTVTVVVSTPTLNLPTPDLSQLNDQTFTLQDSLVLVYNGDATGFNWEFDPLNGTVSNSNLNIQQARVSPGQAVISTPAPRLSFGSLNLQTGTYTLRVQAVNGSQTSPWASATITLVGTDLASARVYPNPWRKDKHDGHPITFDQLTGDVDIKIFTVSGHLVRDLGNINGITTWDLRNASGEEAASGLYIYLIQDNQGNKTKGKLAIIR